MYSSRSDHGWQNSCVPVPRSVTLIAVPLFELHDHPGAQNLAHVPVPRNMKLDVLPFFELHAHSAGAGAAQHEAHRRAAL